MGGENMVRRKEKGLITGEVEKNKGTRYHQPLVPFSENSPHCQHPCPCPCLCHMYFSKDAEAVIGWNLVDLRPSRAPSTVGAGNTVSVTHSLTLMGSLKGTK